MSATCSSQMCLRDTSWLLCHGFCCVVALGDEYDRRYFSEEYLALRISFRHTTCHVVLSVEIASYASDPGTSLFFLHRISQGSLVDGLTLSFQ